MEEVVVSQAEERMHKQEATTATRMASCFTFEVYLGVYGGSVFVVVQCFCSKLQFATCDELYVLYYVLQYSEYFIYMFVSIETTPKSKILGAQTSSQFD